MLSFSNIPFFALLEMQPRLVVLKNHHWHMKPPKWIKLGQAETFYGEAHLFVVEIIQYGLIIL